MDDKMLQKANRLIATLRQQRESALDQVVDLTASLVEMQQAVQELAKEVAYLQSSIQAEDISTFPEHPKDTPITQELATTDAVTE